jgi:hypothetical protein
MNGGIRMLKTKTHFEQVPLTAVKKILGRPPEVENSTGEPEGPKAKMPKEFARQGT